MITGLLPSPDASNPPEEGKINWIPQNEEQYQKLKQQWSIKLPEAEALLRTQLGLKGDGGKEAYAYTNEEGKTVTLMLNPREFATKVKQKKYKGLKPYDIHGKETIAAQNDMISNLAAAEGQRVSNTELEEGKVLWGNRRNRNNTILIFLFLWVKSQPLLIGMILLTGPREWTMKPSSKWLRN